jgi:hypothetical protein
MVSTGLFPKTPPYRVFPAAVDPKDLRRKTVPLLRPRPTSVLRSFRPRPRGRLKTIAWLATASERAQCPSAASQMSAVSSNTLVPPLIRPYPSSPKKISQTPPPPLRRKSICEYLVAENHTGLAEREIFVPVHGYYVFPKPSVQGFTKAAYPVDRSCRCLV